jgi:uroporphyrinogen-III synthase
MRKVFEAKVLTSRIKLSPRDAATYKRPDVFDWILFSSKHAAHYFAEDVRKRKIILPRGPRIAAIGKVTAEVLKRNKIKVDVIPREATLKDMIRSLGSLDGVRILFPRSAIAPTDAIISMRKRGAIVRTIQLYTTAPAPLTKTEKNMLLSGTFTTLNFKSPSGINGFLNHFKTNERRFILTLPAECIGPSTSEVARKAGFRKVKDLSI